MPTSTDPTRALFNMGHLPVRFWFVVSLIACRPHRANRASRRGAPRTITPCNLVSLKPGSRYPSNAERLPRADERQGKRRSLAQETSAGPTQEMRTIAMSFADEVRKAAGEIAKKV